MTGPLTLAAVSDRLEVERRRAALRDGYRAALARAAGRQRPGLETTTIIRPEAGLAAIDAAMDALAVIHSSRGPAARRPPFNPYGRLVAALAPGCSPEPRQEILTELRPLLTTTFAYAVPTDRALDRIAGFGEILEIGAGGGYWARCLAARGATVFAFDRLAPLAQRRKAGSLAPHHPILIGGPAEALAAFPRCQTLLLCWPPGISNRREADAGAAPRFSPMGEQALGGFKGTNLVFVGSHGSSFGSPAFFARLARQWQLVEELPLPHLGSWRDSVFIYRRRAG